MVTLKTYTSIFIIPSIAIPTVLGGYVNIPQIESHDDKSMGIRLSSVTNSTETVVLPPHHVYEAKGGSSSGHGSGSSDGGSSGESGSSSGGSSSGGSGSSHGSGSTHGSGSHTSTRTTNAACNLYDPNKNSWYFLGLTLVVNSLV